MSVEPRRPVLMAGRDVTASFAIAYVAFHGGNRVLTVDVIRQWCHRGRVRRVGTDSGGYALYSLDDILRQCFRQGVLIDPQADDVDTAMPPILALHYGEVSF